MTPRRPAVVLLLVLSAAVAAGGDASILGPWDGAISVAGSQLTIRVDLASSDEGLVGTIDIPQQGVQHLPLANLSFEPPKVHFELPAGPGVAQFDGTLAEGSIKGSFRQGAATGSFTLRPGSASHPEIAARTSAPALGYREEEVRFTTADASFAGTLSVPSGTGPHPAAVLITGSGAQNRDEEIFGFRPFRLIANYLARNGVAVLRYDDRGVGGSSPGPDTATTADFANDALGAIAFLKKRPEIDAKRIGLLGHSEGGIVAPIAATRSTDVAFIVMVSGMGVTGERILLDQGALIAKAEGASDEDVAKQEAMQRRIFAAVRTGEGWDAITAEAREMAAAQIAAMSEEQLRTLGDPTTYVDAAIDQQIGAARTPWFKFFLDYDPAAILEKVRCPVLALFGELDLQVPAASNRDAIAAALAKGQNKDVTTKIFPKANHLFQPATTGSPGEYATLPKEFVPEFLETIASWIRSKTGLGAALPTSPTAAARADAVPEPSPAPPPAAGSEEAAAQAFLDLLVKGAYADAAARFDATMKSAMSPTALENAWRSTAAPLGAYRMVTDRERQPAPNGLTVVDLTAVFEHGRLTIRVVLRPDFTIGGLWFRAPKA